MVTTAVIKDRAVVKGERICLEDCIVEEDARIGNNVSLTGVVVRGDACIEGLNIYHSDPVPIYIDKTPVSVRGIGDKPVVIITSPIPLLFIGMTNTCSLNYLASVSLDEIATLFKSFGVNRPEVEAIVRISFTVMKLKGWTQEGARQPARTA